jgi:hypothetical protein
MQKLTKETLKKVKIKLAYSYSCDILSPVSERKNNMKNTMTTNEIRRHFEQRRRRVEKLKADEAKSKKVVTLMIQIN